MIKWTSILTATTSIIREHSNHPWIVMDFCCVKSKSQWVSWHPILPRKVRFLGYLWSSKTRFDHPTTQDAEAGKNRSIVILKKTAKTAQNIIPSDFLFSNHPVALSMLRSPGCLHQDPLHWSLPNAETLKLPNGVFWRGYPWRNQRHRGRSAWNSLGGGNTKVPSVHVLFDVICTNFPRCLDQIKT